jgi:uncharacterized protein YjbI with pentapeptide repeats
MGGFTDRQTEKEITMKTTIKRIITSTAAVAMLTGIAFAADSNCVARIDADTCQKNTTLGYTTVCNCSGATLSNKNMDSKHLAGVNFSTSNTKLDGATFKNADLTGTDFSNANLSGVDMTGAIIPSIVMTGTTFTCAKWVNGTYCDAKSVGKCIQVNTKPKSCN